MQKGSISQGRMHGPVYVYVFHDYMHVCAPAHPGVLINKACLGTASDFGSCQPLGPHAGHTGTETPASNPSDLSQKNL